MAQYWGDMVFSEPYTDKDGQEKKSYHKFGKVFQGEHGNFSIYIPLLGKWFSLYPKQDKQGVNRQNIGQKFQQIQQNQPPEPPPHDSEPPLPF